MERFAAPPALDKIIYTELDSYSCTKCSSNIKIIYFDEKELKITFECLNEDIKNNHQIQTLPINEYLQKMIKNTYLFDKCSICNKTQKSMKNEPIFKYCINCKEIICNQCKEKHINKNNNKENHFLINNNEKRKKCLIHYENNDYIEYCSDCQRNLCKECLKTRNHLNHNKNPLDELSLLNENKMNHKKIIELLKKEKQKLEIERHSKITELNIKINEDRKKVVYNYENKNKEIREKLEADLKLKNEQLNINLKQLEQKYQMEVLEEKNKFEANKNILIENFNKLYEENKKIYNDQLTNFKNLFNNNEYINNLTKKLNNLIDLIKINEILKKTQENNENNFYINENINKVIESFKNCEINEIRKISLQNIQLQKNETFRPIEQAYVPQNNNNFYLSKKIKNENEKQPKMGRYKNMTSKINYLNSNNFNNYNNFNMNLIEDGEIVNKGDNYNIKKKYEKPNYDYRNNDLKIDSYDIISDSYCPIEIDNSFIVFESDNNNNKNIFIAYGTKNKSIICYNLLSKKLETEIPKAHDEYISSLYYCYNYIIHKELIMSISYKDRNLKIWDLNNWQCFIDIKNVYTNGYIYSACFLNKQNNYYFITTNWEQTKFADSIRVYDYNKNVFKNINNSEYNVVLIKVLYNNDKTYLITSNEDNIKSYDYNKNEKFRQYQDNYSYCKILGFIIFISTKKILGSCHDKMIRVWDFFSGKMLYKMNIESNELKGICLSKERNIIIGCDGKAIQLLDLNTGKIIKSLNQHNGKVCSIKKKYLAQYGNCLFSQGFDNHIIFWNLKE